MIQVSIIDDNGLYVEPVLVNKTDVLQANYISNPVPEGLFTPKWNGSEWIEGMPQAEIDFIRGQPKEKTEMEILKEENTLLKAQIQAASDRSDFHEELIAEMAMMVYP